VCFAYTFKTNQAKFKASGSRRRVARGFDSGPSFLIKFTRRFDAITGRESVTATQHARASQRQGAGIGRPDPALEVLRDGIGLAPSGHSPTECHGCFRNAGYGSI
jgi:hypothetical protein